MYNFVIPRLNSSEEIRPKAVGGSIFGRFLNFDKCRPEVASDVISGVALFYVGMGVRAKFGDSRLNSGQIIRLWPGGRVFCTLLCTI